MNSEVCANRSASEIPIASAAERMESMTPTEKSGGVDSVLPRCAGSPAANTMVSVQVPPTSVATMYLRFASLIGNCHYARNVTANSQVSR